MPPDNQPGHHPAKEQDKPDLDAFAAKLGADPKAPSATRARKPARPKDVPPKDVPSKDVPSSVGAPTVIERPAAGWPESAPAAEDLGPLPDPAKSSTPPPEPEPLVVGLALLPLRETVKRLEQLERTLTERLNDRHRGRRRSGATARAGRGSRGR
jgi:hypothetical protein